MPREIVFLDELPRNPTGKVLKRELAKMQPARSENQKPALNDVRTARLVIPS